VAKLVIFRGDSVESELHLGRQSVKIGRDVRNDVVLDDKTVTRFHAEVIPDGGRFYIVDMNSRNGVWVNNQRIKTRTPLELGVPVTVGAYELTLEDDVATSDLSEFIPTATRTVVSTSATPMPERSSGSTTRGRPAAKSTGVGSTLTKPAVFWPLIAVGTLALCAITYLGVRRFMVRPAPPQVAAVPTPPVDPSPPPTPPADPTPLTKDIIAGYLEAVQFAIDDHEFAAAQDDIDAALELDPDNQELQAKRKEIEGLIAAAKEPPPKVERPAPKPVEVVEVPGIQRRPNEAPGDYTARVERIRSNWREGLRSLDQEDYAAALSRFQAVDRDQKGYNNVDGMIADATAKQKRGVDTAINNGQENERANNLVNAVRWYETAARLDPSSAAAQEKLAGIADRRTKQGLEALKNADVLRKRNEIAKAVAAYQQAAYLLPASNEKRAEAQQWLEKLK
jgi:pSer/pThr/pTyr-binding forkhead associated (FHA) protein